MLTLSRIILIDMEDLLFRWFPFITWDQVIITSRKQFIKGDVLIDDGIHNLESVIAGLSCREKGKREKS